MKSISVLGTPLLVTDYASLAEQCLAWAREDRCISMEFANTQIVAMRRHEPAFHEVTESYDYFLPDGMPLIWCLNFAGASLRDRVYGPIFMRRFLETAPAACTHYLLGGSEECAAKLREKFQRLNPGIKFIGGFHGKCGVSGRLEGVADEGVVAEINRLSPDIVWVGLGTPRQQAWIREHKHLIKRGVLLGVGFAFDVNAGTKPDAPSWMQRAGLTWLYRLASEPRRLLPRYLRYNSLFLYYLLADGLRRRTFAPAR